MSRPSADGDGVRPTTSDRPGFRGDVQGLRAIAVLVVIAAHAGVPFLPGGFVGVDVFFVISGFLITGLLLGDVARNGRVSLRDFYARRARRILPAATVVTVVVVVASFAWLSVVDALSVATDAVWATFFAANIRFISVGTDYDAFDLGPSPLQHYWSLAVEEQFYLVWPLVLLLCVALARRLHRRRAGASTEARATEQRTPRVAVFWVLVVVTGVSFAYGVLETAQAPTAAYFSTPARAWELGVGALVALVGPTLARRLPSTARGLLTLTGLGMITAACLSLDGTTAFPGVAALTPVLGCAAVLLAGAGGHDREPLPVRALGVAPMRVVGDWSYSLYLWHWPLLVVAARLDGGLTAWDKAGLVALTFVLAAFTHRFVEAPFRNPRRITRRRALSLYPISALVVCVACYGGNVYGHYKVGEYGDDPAITLGDFGIADEADYPLDPDPTVALVQASVVAARNGMAIPSKLDPGLLGLEEDVADVADCDYTQTPLGARRLCAKGDTGGDKTLVLLGDSHARMWIPAFEKIAEREGYTAYYLVKPNCTGADLTVNEVANGDKPWTACDDFRNWALDEVADLKPDLAVLATSGPGRYIYADGQRIGRENDQRRRLTIQGYADTLDRLDAASDRTVLLRDVPSSDREPSVCLTDGDPDLGDCLVVPTYRNDRDARLSVDAAEQSGVDVVDPVPWVCWSNQCPAVIGDLVPYRDRSHLTTVYTSYLTEDLGRALGVWSD